MLIFTCEHGGHGVPAAYARLFAGQRALLESHRGWDPGALQLARQMADAFGAPLFASTTTRLLIDLNRSIGHPALYSELSRGLTHEEKDRVVARHYNPHREAVRRGMAHALAAGRPVVHIALHSFTPALNGVVRHADVAWLYDPRRAGESLLARRWRAALAARASELRLRFNYPYKGSGDGLATLLRRSHGDGEYVGIELEVNQAWVSQGRARWAGLRERLVESLAAALSAEGASPTR